MISESTMVVITIAFVCALFLIGWYGERSGRLKLRLQKKAGPDDGADDQHDNKPTYALPRDYPWTYALALGVFCTSWSFFGVVGMATRSGFDFVPLYLGPIVLFTAGLPLVQHIIRLSKKHNLVSVSDFLSARFGKSHKVAAVVTMVVLLAVLPYIALQLKAITIAAEVVFGSEWNAASWLSSLMFGDVSFITVVVLMSFTILFGTRNVDIMAHQPGMMLAVAAASVVKILAFIGVGLFVVFSIFNGIEEFTTKALQSATVRATFARPFDGANWLTLGLLSALGVLLLPRQFHVGVAGNRSEREIRYAAVIFPLYMLAFAAFVVPIAIAGILLLSSQNVAPDAYILALPHAQNSQLMLVIAWIGGLSAVMAMVVVEANALALMICNSLVLPFLLRRNYFQRSLHRDVSRSLLFIRRTAIAAVLLLSYIVLVALGSSQELTSLGFISFAAIAQIAPPFFGGLVWRDATARGAIAGLVAGSAVWCYTLLLPWLSDAGWIASEIVNNGPFGIWFLRPEALFFFNADPLTNGVFWSLGINAVAFITVSSLFPIKMSEREQAREFLRAKHGELDEAPFLHNVLQTTLKVGELKKAVARFLGPERANDSFANYASERRIELPEDLEADISLIRYVENLLSRSVGPASARLVLTQLLQKQSSIKQSPRQLLNDVTDTLRYNRDVLQLAIDQVRHGLCVFDDNLKLVCWNRHFREMLDVPPGVVKIGLSLEDLLRVLAEQGYFGPGDIESMVTNRVKKYAVSKEIFQERFYRGGSIVRALEIRTSPMPHGGIVTTFSEITDRVKAASSLARANVGLERRVRERNAELSKVNHELELAKSKADAVNRDKTRFLAAASHDILQPLNAARLYTTTLSERPLSKDDSHLVRGIDAGLDAVEEIFTAVIEISRLDAGRLVPKNEDIAVAKIFEQLAFEFEPMAREKGLQLRLFDTTAWVRSDRRMLRRVLQNLVSNAVKYTREGGVLLGVRNKGDSLIIQVCDTGPGIPSDKISVVFQEFVRLEGAGSQIPGLGLGLSIVERIGRMLDFEVTLKTMAGKGTTFSITVPRGAVATSKSVLAGVSSIGSLPKCLVLCIENENDVLDGMRRLLEAWGCQVIAADSQKAAIQAIRKTGTSPDIILADYHLDLGTGVSAIKAVRNEVGALPPGIIITADSTVNVQRDISNHGLSVLQKPLKAGALRALMTHHLKRQEVAALT